MKKATRLSAVIAIASLAFAAMVGAPAKAADVQLKMVAADYANMQPFWDDLAAKFAKANPGITVKVDVVSWETIDDKVRSEEHTSHIQSH
mgnify:CR=1 FL=1